MKILIIGAGIGGLTTALSLHAAGISDITILEAAINIKDIGVGVNLPPHAVRELTELGLASELADTGILTSELSYYDRSGTLIWTEKRGKEAGYKWPQYSIHRGRLQKLLLTAVRKRLGVGAILTGRRLIQALHDNPNSATATVQNVLTGSTETFHADVMIGADGIRSATRTSLYSPETIPLASNGWVMYRGATSYSPFLSGSTMVIVGDEHQRIVVYPIAKDTLNWLMVRPLPANSNTTELGDWNQPVAAQYVADLLQDWKFDWLDIPDMVSVTKEVYEYPMADIDPLPQWSFNRVTLLGDAAHAMYPFGSNGASQAILDARILANKLVTEPNEIQGLRAYESQRRKAVSSVQLANRNQTSSVMAKVSTLARANAHNQAMSELKDVEQKYKELAGFDVETLNNRPSWSVSETLH